MCPAEEPRNSGQPGCTPAERERHSRLLAAGAGLVDAFRLLHPVARPPGGENEVGAKGYDGGAGFGTDTEGITWRGTAGSDVAEMGRFYGKGMRIDYFLVSKSLAEMVSEVKVFGRGAAREGFLGSDHCPLMLTLREPSKEKREARLAGAGSIASDHARCDGGGKREHGEGAVGSSETGIDTP